MSENGRLDDDELAVIPGTGVRVRRDLAPQLGAWRRAFAARFGKPMQVTDGYRPYSGDYYAQVETMLRRYKPLGEFQRLNPGWSAAAVQRQKSHLWNGVRRYLLPGQAQAAYPGKSNHGWGTAVDLGSRINVRGSAEHEWAVATAPSFGMRWPAEWARAAGEWWHFEDGVVVPVSRYASVPGAIDITIPDLPGIEPITPMEDTMLTIARTATDPTVWVGNGVERRRIATMDTLAGVQWSAQNGLLGPFFKDGEVQTMPDLWVLGHPIDASEEALEQRITAAIAGVKGGTAALDPKATAAAIATALGPTLAGQVVTELSKRLSS